MAYIRCVYVYTYSFLLYTLRKPRSAKLNNNYFLRVQVTNLRVRDINLRAQVTNLRARVTKLLAQVNLPKRTS